VFPRWYVPDGTTRLHLYLCRRQDRHLSRALPVGSLNRLLPPSTFSPLSFPQFLFSLDLFRHARIDPRKQHPRGVAHRHDPLVYVRLTVYHTPSQDLTEPDWPSSIYGVTLLQVYSYFNSYCSRDRWPLKSFVRAPTFTHAQDVNEAVSGRFFDVHISESLAVYFTIVTSSIFD
jgi:hypothetical protein